MSITKAIIPVAGNGTRRLPITKAIEKCMLPIGNRPIVDYVVEDCLKAGITDIIFVVGEQFNQLQTYYGRNMLLEEYLRDKGKTKELEEIIGLAEKATMHYVVQDQHQPYGTAVPVALCADLVNDDEQVLVLMGDDFIYNADGKSEAARHIEATQKAGVTCGMLVTDVPQDRVSQYGVLELEDGYFKSVVEKPETDKAPSNLINISKYIFDKTIFRLAEELISKPSNGGEYQITDVLNTYVSHGNKIAVVPAHGEYLDGGTLEGWLRANNRLFDL